MIAYTIQETKDSEPYLCVSHGGQFHRFPLSVAVASRLASECSGIVQAAISGYSQKHAFAEVSKLLSEKFKPL